VTPNDVPPTSALADVLLLRGRLGVLSPPLHHAAGRSIAARGRARTVAFEMTNEGEGGTFDELYALLDEDLTGSVLVLAGAERVIGAVWGQILSHAARRAGAVAALVAGAVRDVAELRDSPLTIWALSQHTMGATGMARVVGIDVPVTIGVVPVEVGDDIVIDEGGVVRVATDEAIELLERGREYAEAEQHLLRDLAEGVPLAQAYEHKRRMRRRLQQR
jgi:4-hydroxy-4-methyl-2-oxoglutarate aldolase